MLDPVCIALANPQSPLDRQTRGELAADYRRARGISREAVAHQAGYTNGMYYWNLEEGGARWSERALQRYLTALDFLLRPKHRELRRIRRAALAGQPDQAAAAR